MKAFLTGSRAYGEPVRGSDFDLVIHVDAATTATLYEASKMCIACSGSGINSKGSKCFPCDGTGGWRDEPREHSGGGTPDAVSMKFGLLNIIAIADPGLVEVWRDATTFLAARCPVTRERAVAYIKKKIKRYKEAANG